MTFEKTLARFRKVSETLEELKDALVALTGERDKLEHEILIVCANDVSKYNVFVRKNGAAGLDGREYFNVTFYDALVRARQGQRLDDQKWLVTVDEKYKKSNAVLMKSKVNADHAAGILTDADLRAMGLRYEKSPRLSVKRIPGDVDIQAYLDAAEELHGDVE